MMEFTETIRAVLNYMQDSRENNVVNEETRKLHAMVERVKEKPEVKLAYMRFDEVLYWEKKESHDKGQEEGKEEAYHNMILSFLESLGQISGKLQNQIKGITDISTLEQLVKVAAKADSISDFEKELKTIV